MLNQIIDTIRFETLYVIATFFVAMAFLKRTYINKLLLCIIGINAITEVTALFLLVNNTGITWLYNFYFLSHQGLWLYLIVYSLNKNKKEYILFLFFIGFALSNVFFIEKNGINYYTFIIGAILYLVYFLVKSFRLLKHEDLSFFISKNYILVSAPLLFFIGLCITLGFRDNDIRSTLIFGQKLYWLISLVVNIVFYSLINIYIFKSKK